MIASARYTDAGTGVAVTMNDGTIWHTDATLPPDTEIRRALAAWLAAGGDIEPYTPPAAPRIVTPLQFMDRLSREKQGAITQAAAADPAVLLWLLRLTGAQTVELDNPETVAGVAALREAGVLTTDEEAALLA